jgi:hypothetical protein
MPPFIWQGKVVMKNKIIQILECVFGWGILICMILGFLIFIGFVIAFIVGKELAPTIGLFLQNEVLPWLCILGTIICFIGILSLYLKGEKTFTLSTGKKKNPQEKGTL